MDLMASALFMIDARTYLSEKCRDNSATTAEVNAHSLSSQLYFNKCSFPKFGRISVIIDVPHHWSEYYQTVVNVHSYRPALQVYVYVFVGFDILNSFHAKSLWLLLRYKHQRMSIKTSTLTYIWRKSH